MAEYKKIVAQNKKANFDYFIEQKIEAGIILKGSELKSIREGKASLADSHASDSYGEIYLFNCHIAEYEKANRFNHDTRRPKKLLLHKVEIRKIIGKIKLKGYTLVALSMYFNEKNKVKIELGLARGKKLYDKRQSLKEKDLQREQGKIIRDRNNEY